MEPNSGINIKKSRRSIKKIQVGWLNYDNDKRRYIAVRQSRGGGTRDVNVPLGVTVELIIQTAMEFFFPDGVSPYGVLSDMEVNLANYRQQ